MKKISTCSALIGLFFTFLLGTVENLNACPNWPGFTTVGCMDSSSATSFGYLCSGNIGECAGDPSISCCYAPH